MPVGKWGFMLYRHQTALKSEATVFASTKESAVLQVPVLAKVCRAISLQPRLPRLSHPMSLACQTHRWQGRPVLLAGMSPSGPEQVQQFRRPPPGLVVEVPNVISMYTLTSRRPVWCLKRLRDATHQQFAVSWPDAFACKLLCKVCKDVV